MIGSVTSESTNAMAVGTTPFGAPPDNCSILCSQTASCSSDDSPSLVSSLHSSSSSVSTASPPSPFSKPPSTCGEFTTVYDSDAESSVLEAYPDGGGYSMTMHPMLKMVLLAILSRDFLCLVSFRERTCLWLRICIEGPSIRLRLRA